MTHKKILLLLLLTLPLAGLAMDFLFNPRSYGVDPKTISSAVSSFCFLVLPFIAACYVVLYFKPRFFPKKPLSQTQLMLINGHEIFRFLHKHNQMRPPFSIFLWYLFFLFLFPLLWGFVPKDHSHIPVTIEKFNAVQEGMRLEKVNRIVGFKGKKVGAGRIPPRGAFGSIRTFEYTWTNPDGSGFSASFVNYKLKAKYSHGVLKSNVSG